MQLLNLFIYLFVSFYFNFWCDKLTVFTDLIHVDVNVTIVLYFWGESGTTFLTCLMLTFPIYEAVSFITATFHFVVKQRVANGGPGINLCLKEMMNEFFHFCVALFVFEGSSPWPQSNICDIR